MNNPSYQNRENIYRQSSPFPVKKNKFDLSYRHKTNVQLGKLIPIGWTTVLPGDKVKVFVKYRAVLETLAKNGFYDLDICFRSYFVSNRQMWNKWDNFYTGGQDGNYSVLPPSINLNKNFTNGGLRDYLGLPISNQVTSPNGININPFPFVAYDLIVYNNFINPHIEKNLPYYVKSDSVSSGISGLCSNDFYAPSGFYCRMFDDNNSLLTYLNNNGYPEINNIYAANDIVYNVNWEGDYFTSAHLTQSLGTPPVIPITSNLEFTNTEPSYNDFIGSVVGVKGLQPEYNGVATVTVSAVQTNKAQFGEGFITGRSLTPGDYDLRVSSTKGTFDYIKSILETGVITNMGFNAFDIRTIFQTTVVQEGSLLGGWEPWDYLQYFFGTRPSDYAMQRPVYIGGFNGKFYTDEVYSTSDTTDMPLGSYAGKGDSGDDGYLGVYDVKEFGIVMILCYIRPKGFAYSSQGIRKELMARDRWAWLNPAFVNLQEQPIKNYELYATGEKEDFDTFGFQSIYDEFRMNKDVVTCDMRDNLSFWHTNRIFDECPVLNPEFLKMKNDDMDRIFMFQDNEIKKRNQVFLNVLNGFLIDRNLPILSIPGKLDHRY